jgi:hypothetical protein
MEPVMSESQVFSPAAYSVTPVDLIPDDDDEDPDVQWLEYCRVAATIDRQHILECVLSDLDAEDSPLYDFIDDAISNPHEPGRAKANLVELAKLGQAMLNLIVKSVDDQVNLRMAVEVRHG